MMQLKNYLKLNNSILVVFLIISYNICKAQNTTSDSKKFVSDSIVLKLPSHRDGRFIDIKQLDSIKSLLNRKDYSYIIKINISFGTKNFSQEYSNHLKTSLERYLSNSKVNYFIISNGSKYPVTADKKDKIKNDRLIIVQTKVGNVQKCW